MIKPVSLATAKKIFKSVFPKKNIKIDSIKLNTGGHTNISYCVVCGDKKYQLKFARPGAIKNLPSEIRFNEIMGYGGYVYKNTKNGITVRKWIDGRTLNAWGIRSIEDLTTIFSEIKKIHALPEKYFKYFAPIGLLKSRFYLKTLPKKYHKKYLELVKKYKNDKLCISKVDNVGNNILRSSNDKLYHIDNEWVQLANEYWDFAENIRWILDFNWQKINFKKYIKNFNMKKLKDFVFMSCVYNYLWTFRMDPDKAMGYYRRYLKRSIINSFKILD